MKYLVLLCILALTACGGGGSSPEVVALYGDSITAGVYYDNGVRTQLTPTPVQRIAAYSGLPCLDYSAPGEGVAGFRRRADGASVAVLRYGMADAHYGTPPEVFRAGLLAAIAQLGGKRVILTSIPRGVEGVDALNAVIADVAAGLIVVPDGTFSDGMHPTPEYADRIAKSVGDYLRKEFQ